MRLTAHPFQQKLLSDARAALREVNSIVVQLPTGGGKTVVATIMIDGIERAGLRAYFVVNRQELIEQSAATFEKAGVAFGIISAGYKPNPFLPVQICSVDTLRSRLASGTAIARPDWVFWDECHHVGAGSWRGVKKAFGSARHVGFSATPERLDGIGLDLEFDRLVCGPSTGWLIEHGYLSEFDFWDASSLDMSGVPIRRGEFVGEARDAAIGRSRIVGDAVQTYLQYGAGERGIIFASSVKRSLEAVEKFRAAGVRAVHLDGDTERHERRRIIKAFRRGGEIDLLANVELFGEGFDVPDAVCAIDLNPTASLTRCMQRWGRVMRKAEGKRAKMFDHAGNRARHGLPDDERAWTLKGWRDRDDVAPREASIGKPFGAAAPAERKLLEVEGDLRQVDVQAVRAQRRAEEQGALSLDDLVELGIRRGYRAPEAWAKDFWSARDDLHP